MVSHKTGFHQNIHHFDHTFIKKEIKKQERKNKAERDIRFNEREFISDITKKFDLDTAEKIINHAFKPCDAAKQNQKTPTAADLHREERKRTKKMMRSRRR